MRYIENDDEYEKAVADVAENFNWIRVYDLSELRVGCFMRHPYGKNNSPDLLFNLGSIKIGFELKGSKGKKVLFNSTMPNNSPIPLYYICNSKIAGTIIFKGEHVNPKENVEKLKNVDNYKDSLLCQTNQEIIDGMDKTGECRIILRLRSFYDIRGMNLWDCAKKYRWSEHCKRELEMIDSKGS